MEFVKKYKWLLLVLGSVLLIVIVVSSRRGSETAVKPEGKDGSSAMNFYLNMFSGREGGPDLDPSKVKTFEVARRDFIRKVMVEKDPVCVGEDFQVKVLADDPEGRGQDLIYKIGSKVGNPVIMRYQVEGDYEIMVTVRDFKRIDTKSVTVRAVKCPDKPVIWLKAHLHPMRPEEGEFEVVRKQGLSGKCAYAWDFGDGATKTTDIGYTTHNYFNREQKRFHSTFIVQVTVTDEKGNRGTARSSLDFPNTQWIASKMGSTTIPIAYNRFPVYKDGRYTTELGMKNIFDRNLTFTDADVDFTHCDTSRRPLSRTYSADAFLSHSVVAHNSVVNGTFSFTKELLPPSTCNLTVRLRGTLQGGGDVTANLYFTIPASGEDLKYKKHVQVDDPELDRKVQKAKKILGKDFVTVDELRTLEKEGKL